MIKIGFVGYGEWGPNMVRTFNSIREAAIGAIYDINQDKLNSAKKQYPNVKVSRDYFDLLEDNDAVVITSPPATHYKFAKEALLRGLHVLVEKPFVLDSGHAKELIKLAEKKKKVLMIGHILQYHPAVLYLKEYISSGKAGKIYYLYAQRLNLGRIRKEENVIWSFGPHDISALLYILGILPLSVSVQSESYLQDGVADVAFLTLKFPKGILAHIHLSWLDPSKTRKLTIVGSEKMLIFDDMEPSAKVCIFDKGINGPPKYQNYGELLSLRNGDIHMPFIKPTEPLRNECEHFLDCIQNNKAPKSGGTNGLAVLKILEAAQKSLEAKESVKDVKIKWQ